MDTLTRLQNWFDSQCDGEWEHHHGVSIETLDNPGWRVKIDVNGTRLAGRAFSLVSKNVSQGFIDQSMGKIKPPFVVASPLSNVWMVCFVKENKFEGAGDASQLDTLLSLFLDWAEK